MPSRLKALGERLLPPRKRQALADERKAAQAAVAEHRRRERIETRRQAVLESDTDVRTLTVAGRTFYGRGVSSFTAPSASAHNLTLVTEALREAGVGYFLVPGRSRTRHVVGARFADRKRILTALREKYDSSVLYAMKPGSDPWPDEAVLYADGSLPTTLKRQDVIRFGEILLGPADQVLADLSFGCDVEFWREGAELLENERAAERLDGLRSQAPTAVLQDALVAPRTNAVTDTLPECARISASRVVGGQEHPTFQDFLQPRIDTVDFPVDVVYTWVDGSDPELATKRAEYRNNGASSRIHARETGASRYTSHDELKYSLRSLEMYAPFVRDVYIVTDGQRPEWLNTEVDGIHIVDHKEIFNDPSALPVFNSHAIETQLHHIPGLSDHYLYFNDDFFLGRPVTAEHFFHGNGVAKLPFSPFQLGLGDPHPDEPAPNSAGKNVRRLLLDAHGRFTVNKFKHTPHPQLREVMAELEERFADDVDRTSRSRFRDVTDIAMAASLHHHHAFLTGRAVPGTYKLRYIDVARPDAAAAMAELARARSHDFFCLNDVNTPADQQESVAADLHRFLEAYFPFSSRFEH